MQKWLTHRHAIATGGRWYLGNPLSTTGILRGRSVFGFSDHATDCNAGSLARSAEVRIAQSRRQTISGRHLQCLNNRKPGGIRTAGVQIVVKPCRGFLHGRHSQDAGHFLVDRYACALNNALQEIHAEIQ